MQTLNYKNYSGSIESDLERDMLRGKILCISDLVTYEASDLKTLRSEFEAAVDDYVETCREIGKSPQKPFNGVFQVRISPELHRQAVMRSIKDGVKLNAIVVSALEAYVTPDLPVVHVHNHDHQITVKTAPALRSSNVSVGQEWMEIKLTEEMQNGSLHH